MENYKAGTKGNKYFLQVYQGLSFLHGGIGNLDVERILEQEGFQPIYLPDGPFVAIYLKRWLAMKTVLRQLTANDIVVCQFPVYPRMLRLLIRKLYRKGVRLVAIVADIDGLKDRDEQLLRKEIKQYQLFRYFIVHNEAMENWIRSVTVNAHIGQLGPFDFLTTPEFGQRTMGEGINFSGNLAKSGFLKDLHLLSPLRFHLYGEGILSANTLPPNLQFHGVFSPYELPKKIAGSFGLIWDGDSIHSASGSLGHYMAYINHHKLSLYILAGMPVIAAAFAGSAPYIQEKGIGWLVNDLAEIPGLVASITPAEYHSARNKMVSIAVEISKGNHLKNALRNLISS